MGVGNEAKVEAAQLEDKKVKNGFREPERGLVGVLTTV